MNLSAKFRAKGLNLGVIASFAKANRGNLNVELADVFLLMKASALVVWSICHR